MVRLEQWEENHDDAERRMRRAFRHARRGVQRLYEDDDLVVVNRPAWPAAADGGFASDLEPTDEVFGLDPDWRPAVELDPLLSGAVAYSKTVAGERWLNKQIESAQLRIQCLTLVRGHFMEADGIIEAPIVDDETGLCVVRAGQGGGHPARTVWKRLDAFITYAYLECSPDAPSPDQVRAHLQSIGLPVIADARYGGGVSLRLSEFKPGYHPSARHPERPLIQRPGLHVAGLRLMHPSTGRELSFEAPPPKDFRAALQQLQRFGRLPR